MNEQTLAQELEDYQQEMFRIVEEMEVALRDAPSNVRAQAEAYWIGHLKAALGDDNYASMCNVQDTINELNGSDEDDDVRTALDDELDKLFAARS